MSKRIELNEGLDYKRALEYVFNRLYSRIEILSMQADKNIQQYETDAMKAYYTGEMIGYERAVRELDITKGYIEEITPDTTE